MSRGQNPACGIQACTSRQQYWWLQLAYFFSSVRLADELGCMKVWVVNTSTTIGKGMALPKADAS